MGARDEVDGDGVLLARDVERRGLPGEPDQLLEVGPCDQADVESRQNGVCETDDANTEAVPAGLGVVFDETRRRQGPELS